MMQSPTNQSMHISIIDWAIILVVFNHWSHHITQVKTTAQTTMQWSINAMINQCMILWKLWHIKLALTNSNVIVKRNQPLSSTDYNLCHRKDVNNVQNLYWNHSAAPPLALNIFDLISMIDKVLNNKLNSTCILIGSFMCLWSIGEQTHRWHQH